MTKPATPGAFGADEALARACERGDADAWERLVRDYKPVLARAARAMDVSGAAEDLAEELFAELYERSLFRYYQGRSSLQTWLRAVLAQRYVDRVRATRRLVGQVEDSTPAPDRDAHPGERVCRACVDDAMTSAVNALEARDRLLLRLYYTKKVRLAAIGRMTGEHEATVSRHLTRVRQVLREYIESALLASESAMRMSSAECLRRVMTDTGDLDLGRLLARSDDQAVHNERETDAHRPS